MMPRRCCLGKHTIGGTGAYAVAVTAYTSGLMQQPLSCQMVVMDGLGSSWMENLLPCTRVEVLRVGRIVQVSV